MNPDPGPLASENSDQMIRFNLFRFLSGKKVQFHLSRKSYRKFHSNGKRSMFIHFFCVLWSPVYTGQDKHLHGQKLPQFHLAFTRDRRIFEPRVCGPGQKLPQFHLAFTRDRRNWTNFWTAKYVSFGPSFFWSQTSTQKFVQFRRSRVKAEWNRARFCSFKNLSAPV